MEVQSEAYEATAEDQGSEADPGIQSQKPGAKIKRSQGEKRETVSLSGFHLSIMSRPRHPRASLPLGTGNMLAQRWHKCTFINVSLSW